MESNDIGARVQATLREAPFAMRQLAEDSGLSYDVLRSWRSGRRRPGRRSILRLADGVHRRGERLIELAALLRQSVDRHD